MSRVKPMLNRVRERYVNFDDADESGVVQESDDPGNPRPRLRRCWHDGPGNDDGPSLSEGSKGTQDEEDDYGTGPPLRKRFKTSLPTQPDPFEGESGQEARSDRSTSQTQMSTRHDITDPAFSQDLRAKKERYRNQQQTRMVCRRMQFLIPRGLSSYSPRIPQADIHETSP